MKSLTFYFKKVNFKRTYSKFLNKYQTLYEIKDSEIYLKILKILEIVNCRKHKIFNDNFFSAKFHLFYKQVLKSKCPRRADNLLVILLTKRISH